jgi:hypothetical protein
MWREDALRRALLASEAEVEAWMRHVLAIVRAAEAGDARLSSAVAERLYRSMLASHRSARQERALIDSGACEPLEEVVPC